MDFGEGIRRLRTARDLTRAQLAEASGVSADTIYQIERRGVSPRLSTVESLAAALGVTTAELVS